MGIAPKEECSYICNQYPRCVCMYFSFQYFQNKCLGFEKISPGFIYIINIKYRADVMLVDKIARLSSIILIVHKVSQHKACVKRNLG